MKNKALSKWTAIISFALGWTLTIINFFLPPIGEISDATLWVLGQSLLYCGAVAGIANYCTNEFHSIRRKLKIQGEGDGEGEA